MDVLNISASERVDLNDLQFGLVDSQVGFQSALVGNLLTNPQGPQVLWVVSGFQASSPGANKVQVTLGSAILGYRNGAVVKYGVVTAQGDPVKVFDVTAYASGTYGVYIRFNYAPSAFSNRTFWSPSGAGYEYASLTATRLQANWDMRIELVSPGSEYVKVATVVLPALTFTDTRPLYFEGRVDAGYANTWGAGNDRNTDRSTYGVHDFQTFTAAMRTCLEDLKGQGLRRWWDPVIGGQNINFSGSPVAGRTAWGDASFYAQGDTNAPSLFFGGTSNGTQKYSRTTNRFIWNVAGANVAAIGVNGLALGSAYADVFLPPAGGLIASGAVGIGTSNPGAYLLNVTGGTAYFGGQTTFNTGITVTGAVTVGTTLGVTGATTLGALTAAATTTGALSSTTGTFSSTLGVTGATSLTTLGTSGLATLASLGVTGAATVGTTLGVTGAATVGTTLGVTGATTMAALSATSGTFSTTLNATGNITSAGNLALSGTTSVLSSSYGGTNNAPTFAFTGVSPQSGIYFDANGNILWTLRGFTKLLTTSTGSTSGAEGLSVYSRNGTGASIFTLYGSNGSTTALNVNGDGTAAFNAGVTCTAINATTGWRTSLGDNQVTPFGNMAASSSGNFGYGASNAGTWQYSAVFSGSIAAVVVHFVNTSATAGALTWSLKKNGVTTVMTSSISSTNAYSAVTATRGTYTFTGGGSGTTAGDYYVLTWSTNAAWSVPSNCLISYCVWVYDST